MAIPLVFLHLDFSSIAFVAPLVVKNHTILMRRFRNLGRPSLDPISFGPKSISPSCSINPQMFLYLLISPYITSVAPSCLICGHQVPTVAILSQWSHMTRHLEKDEQIEGCHASCGERRMDVQVQQVLGFDSPGE